MKHKYEIRERNGVTGFDCEVEIDHRCPQSAIWENRHRVIPQFQAKEKLKQIRIIVEPRDDRIVETKDGLKYVWCPVDYGRCYGTWQSYDGAADIAEYDVENQPAIWVCRDEQGRESHFINIS